MTVLAWDGVTLAADRRMVHGCTIHETTKVHRAKDGSLLGFCGHPSVGQQMVAWYNDKELPYPPQDDDYFATLMVVRPDKTVFMYEVQNIAVELSGPFVAMGSGSEAALAAMHCDANAIEAVGIASLVNSSCGNGVDYLRHA